MTNKRHYYSALEALEAAFEADIGKKLVKRNNEIVDISSGGQGGFYWGEAFSGNIKFVELERQRLLLWFGKTSERHGNGSFPSLWYQKTDKTDDRKRDLANATMVMRHHIDNKDQFGFAVAHEDMLLEGYKGYRCINTPETSDCLVELNKLPDSWLKDQSQNSHIHIRKVPLEFEFGRIHPSKKNTGIPLILYSSNIVDYIIKEIIS